ncbi:MAG: bifunctional phosphoribosylaminoimidazolecarboxamide formyltransferase/IMP cyclohydrolase [bacterium JZ-2024 1]
MKGKNALLSVSDRREIEKAAEILTRNGVTIWSSPGTASYLKNLGFPVLPVEELTGFSTLLQGRIKTLHPKIFGGILARLKNLQDVTELQQWGIPFFDVVIVNYYPFSRKKKENIPLEELLEYIDIGGPAMLRAAAKNFPYSLPLFDPDDYVPFLSRWAQGELTFQDRLRLATKAFTYSVQYDAEILHYFQNLLSSDFPETFLLIGTKIQQNRYGENPHQKSAWYKTSAKGCSSLTLLSGKELSYNNLLDISSAYQFLVDIPEKYFCVIIKHTNPTGAAVADNPAEAYQKALQVNEKSAFGGIVGINAEITLPLAEVLSQTFLEVLLAPAIQPDALEFLSKKKKNLRIVTGEISRVEDWEVRSIPGGFLLQNPDILDDNPRNWQQVSGSPVSEEMMENLYFAWRVVKNVKSNAVVLVKQKCTVGIGCGQTSRIDAVQQALAQAGENARGAVLASEAFFPFPDSVTVSAAQGISAIAQPGGSIRDEEVIQEARKWGIPMFFTGKRHFRH